MAMSGIDVSCECDKAHDRQKQKEKDVQWTIYKICDVEDHDHDHQQQKGGMRGKKKQEVRVDGCPRTRELSARDNNTPSECQEKMAKLWEEFVQNLPDDQARYACLDHVAHTKSGTFNDKIRFVAWCPESASVKEKMIYSSTKDTVKKRFGNPKETFLASKNRDDTDAALQDMMSAD